MRPFEVFVNGVQQEEGADFRVDGPDARLRPGAEERGQARLLALDVDLVGVAGTYRQNDSVDVAYQRGGKPVVAAKLPLEPLG